MDFISQSLISYLLLYKYITIFSIAFLAAFIVPIPSGNVLMASGAFASVGYLDIYIVVVLSIVGNILGDNLGYLISRKYGEKVLSFIGLRKILQSKKFKNLEISFNKNPGFIIFISRFEILSTLSINLLSGLSKTPYKKYLYHEIAGSISQVIFYSFIGYFFANSWESIGSTIGRVGIIVIFILILFFVGLSRKTLIKKFN